MNAPPNNKKKFFLNLSQKQTASEPLSELFSIELPSKIDKVISLIDENQDRYHENFGHQWSRFSKLQLDSYNGSSESEDRLLNQSELSSQDFFGKNVLEIGSGNGRFTEILLKYGAKVVSVDYSSAIYANFENHLAAVQSNNLICLRADVFEMPIKKEAFDIVLCYGVIQHTGNNEKCLQTLAEYVSPSGLLLVDIYSNSIKDLNPFTYMMRPIFSRLITDHSKRMNAIEKFVNFIFPIQLKILSFVKDRSGIWKFIRLIVNRSPNSVYGINLYLAEKISLESAKNWSICDTNDAWTPQHDKPVSFLKWNNILNSLSAKAALKILVVKKCGQGNCALLQKNGMLD